MNLYQPTITGSLSVSGSVNISGSITIAGGGTISGTASYATNAELLDGLDSTQFTLTSSFAAQTASFTAFTSSQNILNGTYATTGSNTFKNPQTINSNLTVTGSITAQTLVVQTVTSSVIYSSGSNIFGNASSNTQTFTGSMLVTGSVGIGITNPTFPLEVSSISTTLLARFTSNQTNAAIRIVNSSAGLGRTYSIGSGDTGSVAGNNFYIYDETANATRFVISGSGNVGIGTISPSGSFHVQATNSGIIFDTATAYTPRIKAAGALSDLQIESVGNGGNLILSAPGTTSIMTMTTNGAERMRISAAGYVSIGKTSSQSKALELYQSTDAALRIQNSTTGTGNSDGFLLEMGGSNVLIYNYESGNISLGTAATERMGISSAGYITTPAQPAFYAYGSNGTTSSTGNYAGFNLTRLNRGSHYSTSTGRFTAPIAGVYRFVFSALYRKLAGTAAGEISISINGTNVNSRGLAYANNGSTDGHTPMVAELIISLSASDYVMPFIYGVGASSDFYMDANLAYFCGYLIG